LECVVNVSEGTSPGLLGELAEACGTTLLDVHSDGYHGRSVFTLAGDDREFVESAKQLTRAAVARLDLTTHRGVHPRLGVVDVVPFVPIELGTFEQGTFGLDTFEQGTFEQGTVEQGTVELGTVSACLDLAPACAARDEFGVWAALELELPVFFYGPLADGAPDRTLPELRRGAFGACAPDVGPRRPHPTAGAICVGARQALVAYNIWLEEPDLARAKAIAQAIRGPEVRALGLAVGTGVQVSCNLVAPFKVGPGAVTEAVAALATVERCELVGLLPAGVLAAEPQSRWGELDLAADRTVEARLAHAR